MKKSFLDDYREGEIAAGARIATNLLTDDFTIRDPRALYPEYDIEGGLALHRPGVNLAALLFLHPRVITYVPPMLPEHFPGRFGITFDTFMELAYPSDDETDPFIYPLLNHPRHYARPDIRTGLSRLLIRMPPTWERWHEALRASGGIRWFEESDERFPYKAIWSLPHYRSYWDGRLPERSKAFVSREIKQQLKNNYTDLCLVGMVDEAREIALLAATDPDLALGRLFFSSEIFAYPDVMGAGGTPQLLALNPLHMREFLKATLETGVPGEDAAAMDTEVVEVLLEGLEFHRIPSVSRVEFLKSFHKSEQAQLVREAYYALLDNAMSQRPELENIHSAIKTIVGALRDYCDELEEDAEAKADQSAARTSLRNVLLSLGGALLGAGGFFGAPQLLAGVASSSATVLSLMPKATRQRVMVDILASYFPDVPKELITDYTALRLHRKEELGRLFKLGGEPPPEPAVRPPSSSLKVRTVWWTDESDK